MIEVANLSVTKGETRLLSNVNLKVSQGELVGILGPNGAGKSTLINVIAGFERFDGALSLWGQRQAWRRPRSTRLRIGYIPQTFEVDPAFPISAVEAVLTGAVGRVGLLRRAGVSEKQDAMRLLEMMRVGHLARRPLGQLSGGERQKVFLARAIIQKPDILLLDEPTSNLDIAVQREVLNLIDEIHLAHSITMLMVTHDFNLLPASMERAVLLKRGRLVFDGEIRQALSGENLSKLFDYPLATFDQDGRRFVSYA